MGTVRAMAGMMPRIMAGETLDAAAATALASGTGSAVERAHADLVRVARGEAAQAPTRPSPGALAAMGIKVEIAGNG